MIFNGENIREGQYGEGFKLTNPWVEPSLEVQSEYCEFILRETLCTHSPEYMVHTKANAQTIGDFSARSRSTKAYGSAKCHATVVVEDVLLAGAGASLSSDRPTFSSLVFGDVTVTVTVVLDSLSCTNVTDELFCD